MAEIYTDKNSLPKSPTQLEKVGLSFSSLFSLARACVLGDIAPLSFLHSDNKSWLCCLFTRQLPDINVTLEAMLQPKATSLPGHIQAVYVQNIAKLYAKLLANQEEVSSYNRTSMCDQL